MLITKKSILFHVLLSSFIVYTQNKNFNVIISADNNLTHIYADKMILHYDNETSEKIDIKFYQGNLVMKNKDYKKVSSEKVQGIDLLVVYVENCGNNNYRYEYEIEDFRTAWLVEDSYFILYIYNTNKREYKKIFDPIPGKEFTFEYDWGYGMNMRRVQKKLTKKQRKCLK